MGNCWLSLSPDSWACQLWNSLSEDLRPRSHIFTRKSYLERIQFCYLCHPFIWPLITCPPGCLILFHSLYFLLPDLISFHHYSPIKHTVTVYSVMWIWTPNSDHVLQLKGFQALPLTVINRNYTSAECSDGLGPVSWPTPLFSFSCRGNVKDWTSFVWD